MTNCLMQLYLVALGERVLDAGGWLHVVCRCLYHSRSRGEGPVLEAVCNALNLGTTYLLLLGRKYRFLVLHTPLHCIRILKGATLDKDILTVNRLLSLNYSEQPHFKAFFKNVLSTQSFFYKSI